MDKRALRARIRAEKRAMSVEAMEAKSAALGRLLTETPEYRAASAVYGYYPCNQEVRLLPILGLAMAQGKRVALPRIVDGEMIFLYVTDLTRVSPGFGGIPEPTEGERARDPRALVLLPGLAFDSAGRRLGYGGGFYDRFLALEPEHPTVALCYDFQMVPEVPAEAHDLPAGRVLWA